MLKNCLAFFGLIFLAVLGAIGVFLLFSFYDLTLPADATLLINGTPNTPSDLGPVETLLSGSPNVEWSNPLDSEPFPTLPPEPTATPTPVPPLDPAVYRTEVMLRLKEFAAALQSFVDANEQLSENTALIDDSSWRSQVSVALDQVAAAGQSLSAIDPPPVEYQSVDSLLKQIAPQAEGLRSSYLLALDTRGAQGFTQAGDHFNRIKEYLYQAVAEITRLGWPLE